ncbi:MAG TPA: hypothetical protein VK206_09975 [Anaerolineales bacterium]|nr:hypothetical protein [Anaerolineales bacterium]
MTDLPSGTVTFLFTDIEGSTVWKGRNTLRNILAIYRGIMIEARMNEG